MIDVGLFYVDRGAIRDREQLLNGCLGAVSLESFVTLAEGFRYGSSQCFAGFFGNGLRETMRFWVFDIQGHRDFLL